MVQIRKADEEDGMVEVMGLGIILMTKLVVVAVELLI